MLSVQFISGVSLSKTIFVSIPSIDDEELKYTVGYIFDNAKHPERVNVGISLIAKKRKSVKELKEILKKYPNVKAVTHKQKYNDLSTLGVGFNRKRAENLYNGEDYFLQVDSHSFFETAWDSRIIDLFEEATREVGDNNIVLTCIPPIYGYSHEGNPLATGPTTRYPQYVRSELFVGSVPKWADIDIFEFTNKKFLPSPKANSAMMFGNYKLAKDVGTKVGSMFYDEEFIYSVELFGRGMALVFPNVEYFPVRHLDGDFTVPHHNRSFMLEYLDDSKQEELHAKLQKHYWSYINNPLNAKKLEKYKKYAKIDYRYGFFSSQPIFIPKDYR